MAERPESGLDVADAADDQAAAAGQLPVTPAEPFRGGYAETPAETAARGHAATVRRRGVRPHLLELPLRYPAPLYAQVVDGLRELADRRRCTLPEVVALLVADELGRST